MQMLYRPQKQNFAFKFPQDIANFGNEVFSVKRNFLKNCSSFAVFHIQHVYDSKTVRRISLHAMLNIYVCMKPKPKFRFCGLDFHNCRVLD